MDRRYDTYLLRWWHSDGGERAEVQHIQTGERTALPSLAAACSWLLTRYDEAAPLAVAQHDEHNDAAANRT